MPSCDWSSRRHSVGIRARGLRIDCRLIPGSGTTERRARLAEIPCEERASQPEGDSKSRSSPPGSGCPEVLDVLLQGLEPPSEFKSPDPRRLVNFLEVHDSGEL